MTGTILGIFDSGIGGLTVVKELIKVFPSTPCLYFGDSARFPYGSKSDETVCRYAVENSQFLIDKGATAIVIACNTATSVALSLLQKTFTTPIFGVIKPAADEAAKKTRSKKIAVIGTSVTIRSKSYEKAIHAVDPSITVFSSACPLLVTMIEEGAPSSKIRKAIIEAYILPLLEKEIDTIILGCTHYSLIKEEIAAQIGNTIHLIDPAESASHAIYQALKNKSTPTKPSPLRSINPLTCYVSDDIAKFCSSGESFLGFPITNAQRNVL